MGIELAGDRYGKSGIRLVAVRRDGPRHELHDLTVDVSLGGDFADAYLAGDNRKVLTTDAMRGTVYGLARELGVAGPETFGIVLARHFAATVASVASARVHVVAEPWERVRVDGIEHGHSFVGGAGGRRTATVTFDGGATHVVAGVDGMLLLKTTGSAFSGFLTERFTTLAETEDRIMATAVDARWRYAVSDSAPARFDETWATVRRVLVETFTNHDESRSVQHTLWAMGHAVLAAAPDVAELRLAMPNKHHLLVDLAPYGLDNPGEIFVATDRPYGLIEGTVARAGTVPVPGAW